MLRDLFWDAVKQVSAGMYDTYQEIYTQLVLVCGHDLTPVNFIYIIQDFFTGRVAIVWLPQCQRGIYIQWNLSVTTTFTIKFITCDLFSNVL